MVSFFAITWRQANLASRYLAWWQVLHGNTALTARNSKA
jgi:hypothetical protein